MEKNKRYSLIVGLLIFIIVVLLGVCVAFGLGVINTNKGDVINNSSNEQNGVSQEEVKVEEKVEYRPLVETAMEKGDKRKVEPGCLDSDNIASINLRLPKINIDTENVKKINNEILNYANDELEGFKEWTKLLYEYVSYTYKYIAGRDMLLVVITESIAAECSSGGRNFMSYVYDIKNDKFLTVNDFGITDKDLKENAYYEAEKMYGEDWESDRENEKEMIDSSIANKHYKIINVDQDEIEIDFDIPFEDFRVTFVNDYEQ